MDGIRTRKVLFMFAVAAEAVETFANVIWTNNYAISFQFNWCQKLVWICHAWDLFLTKTVAGCRLVHFMDTKRNKDAEWSHLQAEKFLEAFQLKSWLSLISSALLKTLSVRLRKSHQWSEPQMASHPPKSNPLPQLHSISYHRSEICLIKNDKSQNLFNLLMEKLF